MLTWWSYNQYVQPNSTFFESHDQFLATNEPTHLDCLLPPAKPPDSGEGCETMCSHAQFTFRGDISHEFASTTKYFCYIIISSTLWVLLVTLQTVMGGTDNMSSILNEGRSIAENWLSAIPWVQLQLPSSLEANVWSVQQIFRTPVQDFDTCPVLKLLPS